MKPHSFVSDFHTPSFPQLLSLKNSATAVTKGWVRLAQEVSKYHDILKELFII